MKMSFSLHHLLSKKLIKAVEDLERFELILLVVIKSTAVLKILKLSSFLGLNLSFYQMNIG